MMTVYGIKNCDTVKKSTQWLKDHDLPFEFQDYKQKGISPEKLKDWCSQVGWEQLLNRKGTTWRQLEEKEKQAVTNETAAIKVMSEKTSLIKRPVIERNRKVLLIGFNDEAYKKELC